MKIRCDYCGKILDIQKDEDIEKHLEECKNYQEILGIINKGG